MTAPEVARESTDTQTLLQVDEAGDGSCERKQKKAHNDQDITRSSLHELSHQHDDI